MLSLGFSSHYFQYNFQLVDFIVPRNQVYEKIQKSKKASKSSLIVRVMETIYAEDMKPSVLSLLEQS